jgi:hypothetical protein
VGLSFSEGANSAKIANVMMAAVASRVFQDITVISSWGAILLFYYDLPVLINLLLLHLLLPIFFV